MFIRQEIPKAQKAQKEVQSSRGEERSEELFEALKLGTPETDETEEAHVAVN